MSSILRQHAEEQFASELEELIKQDKNVKPQNWQLSPQAVVTYLVGGKLSNGFEITPKYIGSRRLMEIAVATLTTDRPVYMACLVQRNHGYRSILLQQLRAIQQWLYKEQQVQEKRLFGMGGIMRGYFLPVR